VWNNITSQKEKNKNMGTYNTEEIELREIKSVPIITYGKLLKEIFPKEKKLVLFFDFDGTLSPIVKNPEEAYISDEMKRALKKCSDKFTVSIISGRDMDDVKSRVGIDKLIYAGSHGFRITGPDGLSMEHEKSEEILPVLDKAGKKLMNKFSDGPEGVQVERKKYAIAVHYRNADESNLHEINNKIKEVLKQYPEMKTGKGKKIIEIKPGHDWHKGNAVRWILDRLDLWNNPEVLPVYIGDDVTDEDAFKTLHNKGLSIIVGSHDQLTAANYKLSDVDEVSVLLNKLYEIR
jgi:trehalose 6-phosphate phosphatase